MKRLALLVILLPYVGCQRWGTQDVPLQFSKKWVTGNTQIGRRDANGLPVTIRLRLGDAEAFASDFTIREPFALPCHRVRLLYRQTPTSIPIILAPNWSHIGVLWSYEPQLCFQGSTEWLWHVLIVPERGELPIAVDDRLVLVTREKPTATEEIAVVVLTIPRTSDDFAKQAREGDAPFVVAKTEWLPLGRR